MTSLLFINKKDSIIKLQMIVCVCVSVSCNRRINGEKKKKKEQSCLWPQGHVASTQWPLYARERHLNITNTPFVYGVLIHFPSHSHSLYHIILFIYITLILKPLHFTYPFVILYFYIHTIFFSSAIAIHQI